MSVGPVFKRAKASLKARQELSLVRAGWFSAAVAAVGVVVVMVVLAAGVAGVLEPESGTVTGGATIVTTAGASGGRAVKFGPAVVSTPTPAPSGTPTPAPSGTPLPGGSAVCPAFPAVPDENCTGWRHTGVTLTNCDGTVTQAGQKLDSCYFPEGLTIKAANVTITRSQVHGLVGATYLTNWDFQNLTLIDVEIENAGTVDPNGQAAIGSSNYTCLRCNIHDTGRGANMDSNVTIQDSYIHDQVYVNGAHQTAIGSNGGSGFKVIHNNLSCNSNDFGCSSALSLYGDFAPIDGALVQNNLFNTDGGYCTYGGSTSAKPYPHGINIHYIDNLFGKKYSQVCGFYGPVATWEYGTGDVWTGNRWQDGSGAVTP